MILDATLKADYEPGSNRSDDLACADWRFLLPSLDLKSVLCIGKPSAQTLQILYSLTPDIVIALFSEKEKQLTETFIQNFRKVNVKLIEISTDCVFPVLKESVSFILMSDSTSCKSYMRNNKFWAELIRILDKRGVIYIEKKRFNSFFYLKRTIKKITDRMPVTQQNFWVTPHHGELRTAVPVKNNYISNYFFEKVLFGNSLKKRILSSGGRFLSKTGLIDYVNPRQALLMHKNVTNGQLKSPPIFLQKIAKKNGIDLINYRTGLSARGKYNSNKIIYFLFYKSRKSADIIIKMTRTSRFNDRLEHEYKMLSIVKNKGFAEQNSFPDPLFLGYHKNLAILGQKAMDGSPFRTKTTSKPDCPVAGAAINWIIRLGKASTETKFAVADISGALIKLYNILIQIYDLSDRHQSFLKSRIKRISKFSGTFPVVFNHGDAGTWNILVSASRKIIFLDWEAAEPVGMPLWDLFYFMRSFGNWISRKNGSYDTFENFEQNFLQESKFNGFLKGVILNYCTEIGLDTCLIEPLYYTCWMHRALRQATWADSLQNAHFINVLRLSIDQANAPGLKSIFSVS